MNDQRIDQPNKFGLLSLVVVLAASAIGWGAIIAVGMKAAPLVRTFVGVL